MLLDVSVECMMKINIAIYTIVPANNSILKRMLLITQFVRLHSIQVTNIRWSLGNTY